ncbi:MAG: ABC transporter permease [Bacilli bacterium]
MFNFAIRNLKVFFKDKSSVFFSLLAVFIIIGLYGLFLSDILISNFNGAVGARYLMDSWIMAGLLGVTSVTTTMGAFGIMVEDKTKKINKDFIASPVKNHAIVGGYILSSIFIGIIMSFITLVLAEVYVLINGGELMDFLTLIKTLGLIILTTVANSSIVLFIVSFFNSTNGFATASTVIGTLVGFLTGIYVPIGQLPEVAQIVIKCFPPSHGVALFRQVLTSAPIATTFEGAPVKAVTDMQELLGITYKFGNITVTPFVSVMLLVVTVVAFYGLSIWNVSRKRK